MPTKTNPNKEAVTQSVKKKKRRSRPIKKVRDANPRPYQEPKRDNRKARRALQ